MSSPLELLDVLPQVGRVEWIGLAPERRAPIVPVDAVVASPGRGLEGDRHAKAGRPSKREVTLIQAEHLPVIAALAHREAVHPDRLRRNVVVSGVSLYALRDREFQVGAVRLRGTGTCDPCSRMEAALGAGGFNAMRGHGGITAVVVEGGELRIGDAVRAVGPSSGSWEGT